MTNPYRDKPDHCFWSRAMSWPPPGQVDPVTAEGRITPSDLVATMGSCFAQHLARHIQSLGLRYYVAETAPEDITQIDARKRNYGVFSARYGNVYTVRQAVQLFDRAWGIFTPTEDVWPKNGGYVDAFRPQIEPDPLPSVAEVRTSAEKHMGFVRDVFENANWLVFTLGLTEAWRSKIDGAVYPIAPGVSGGEYDPERHEFVNFNVDEVRADLVLFIQKIRTVNPRCQILLTVSPVPLIATFENRHVWASTTYSKAVLRVAAEEAQAKHKNVIYFPSYEVITSPAADGRYYADDLREVTDLGVRHVMRVFEKHFLQGVSSARSLREPAAYTAPDIICDEEAIAAAVGGREG